MTSRGLGERDHSSSSESKWLFVGRWLRRSGYFGGTPFCFVERREARSYRSRANLLVHGVRTIAGVELKLLGCRRPRSSQLMLRSACDGYGTPTLVLMGVRSRPQKGPKEARLLSTGVSKSVPVFRHGTRCYGRSKDPTEVWSPLGEIFMTAVVARRHEHPVHSLPGCNGSNTAMKRGRR